MERQGGASYFTPLQPARDGQRAPRSMGIEREEEKVRPERRSTPRAAAGWRMHSPSFLLVISNLRPDNPLTHDYSSLTRADPKKETRSSRGADAAIPVAKSKSMRRNAVSVSRSAQPISRPTTSRASRMAPTDRPPPPCPTPPGWGPRDGARVRMHGIKLQFSYIESGARPHHPSITQEGIYTIRAPSASRDTAQQCSTTTQRTVQHRRAGRRILRPSGGAQRLLVVTDIGGNRR